MKKLFIIILPVLIILSSCKNDKVFNSSSFELTSEDSIMVINQVMKATDMFANSNNNLDYNQMMEYWAFKHSDFIGVENLDFIKPNGLYDRVKNFYTTGLDSTNLHWVKRNIIPLSKTFAHLYGEYEIYLEYKSGNAENYYIYYSALLIQDDETWKALRIHESYAVE